VSISTVPDSTGSLAELIQRLGCIAPERIRLHPPPGTATEKDLLSHPDGTKRLCELVDGVLVEKVMGYYESRLAAVLIHFLQSFLDRNDLGIVLGEAGMLRLTPGLVRIPDVSFISWSKFPNRLLPAEPVPDLVPDLAVEILSAGNTDAEMARKLREYFAAGVLVVWYVDPDAQTVRVYTAIDHWTLLTGAQSVHGGNVLPGFTLSVRQWFAEAGQRRTR
jgi:Uma2 family endonuclease